MYVELGLEMSSIVAEELLSLFLNYASVDINEIVYDQQAKRVAIPVSRKEVDFKLSSCRFQSSDVESWDRKQ